MFQKDKKERSSVYHKYFFPFHDVFRDELSHPPCFRLRNKRVLQSANTKRENSSRVRKNLLLEVQSMPKDAIRKLKDKIMIA